MPTRVARRWAPVAPTYRSYQPVLPTANKLLQRKWDEKYYDVHRQRVKEAKPMVDTTPPTTYLHLHLKLKKLQIEEEYWARVERDNRILLEKMSQIMRTKGMIDNKNDYEHKSLSLERRRRELLRVTMENQSVLSRILACNPIYSNEKWAQDWQKNEQMMEEIAHFPQNWYELQKEEEEKKRKKNKKAGEKKDKDEKDEGEQVQEQEQEQEAEAEAD